MCISGHGAIWVELLVNMFLNWCLSVNLCKYLACCKLHPLTRWLRCVTPCRQLPVFFSDFLCPSYFPTLFICLASNLMTYIPRSPSTSSSVLLHNHSFFLSVRLLYYIFASPSPWIFHWHLKRPVLCQTAILQIEISWVLKSLRQIYYFNGESGWGGGGLDYVLIC